MTALLRSPEARLVLRSADPSATAEFMADLARAVRTWDSVLLLAEREGAIVTLTRALATCVDAVPPQALDALRTRSKLTEFRMRALSERAQAAVRALADHGVELLLVKGAAIGARWDHTFCSRPMSDVDIVVRPAQVTQAFGALEAAGWRQSGDPRLHRLLADMHHLPPFLHRELPGLRLELHTTLLPPDNPFRVQLEDLWQRSVPAAGAFAGAKVLSAEDQVLHLAVHFAWQHQFGFGFWRTMRALGFILQDPSFDTARLVALARDTRSTTCCYWTLRLAATTAGMHLPSGLLHALTPPGTESSRRPLDRLFVAQLVRGEGEPSPSAFIARQAWRLALRPGWSGYPELGRSDPTQAWEREFGTYEESTLWSRLRHHTKSWRNWWSFLSRTVAGR